MPPPTYSRELEARARSRLEVEARDLPRAARLLRAAGYAVHESSGLLVLEAPSAVQHPEYVATALVAAGEPPTRLAVIAEDLESHFLRLVATPDSEGRPR